MPETVQSPATNATREETYPADVAPPPGQKTGYDKPDAAQLDALGLNVTLGLLSGSTKLIVRPLIDGQSLAQGFTVEIGSIAAEPSPSAEAQPSEGGSPEVAPEPAQPLVDITKIETVIDPADQAPPQVESVTDAY